jgi:shikimate dehydrogenase
MPRAAVVGQPISHSLSPDLHRAAYSALGLSDWTYTSIECGEGGFADLLRDDWAGLSVTMPCKRVALTHADSASELATAVGAANTVVQRGGQWYADNTDVPGLIRALAEVGVHSGSGAVILGAGGTAQAALAALRELGESKPTVLVREPARAGELRATAERLGVRPDIRAGLDDPVLYSAPLVIATLPRGAADPLARPARWSRDGVVFDVIYDPWPTELARSARQAGRVVVSGLDLLLHQALGQVELMTGQAAPLEAMRAALAGRTGSTTDHQHA